MGFGVRLAPGVRVRVSSRGVRTSVGPRIARVHVGAGRTGFSTGIGPVSYSTTLGGSSRSYSSGGSSSGRSYSSYSSSYGTSGRTVSEKADAAKKIENTLKLWTKAHLRNFDLAKRPIAPLPQTPSYETVFKAQKQKFLKDISIFKFAERKAAKLQAIQSAVAVKNQIDEQAKAAQANEQAELDKSWNLMLAADPTEVYARITDAFGDNESKAAILDVEAKTASILVLVPPIDVLPEKDWSYTSAGNLSVKAMTAAARNNYYVELVRSQALVTAKEAFAVCPSLEAVKLLVIRNKSNGAKSDFDCIAFGTVSSSQLKSNLTKDVAASSIIFDASRDWRENLNAKLQYSPLDLAAEPEIRSVLEEVAKGEAEFGQEATDHVGVVIDERVSEAAKTKAAAPKRRTDAPVERRASREVPPEKIKDENLAIQVLIFSSTRDTVTTEQIKMLTELSDSEVAQMVEFLGFVGVISKTQTAGTFKVRCSPSQVESLSNDIRDSISFRRL